MRRLDRTWVEDERAYSAGGRVIDVIYNAALLTIHAVAAERGYDGPSRNDARARLIAERLCESPPFFAGTTLPNPDTMFHTPGLARGPRHASTARWTRRSTRRSPRA